VSLTGGNRNDVTQLLPLLDNPPSAVLSAGHGVGPTCSSLIAATTTTNIGAWCGHVASAR
jgi:hypothetical protein